LGVRAARAERQKSGTAFALYGIAAMKHTSENPEFPSRTELLLARARRAQQRGERRQALVALREATLLAETDPRLWALYGAACAKSNRLDEAERAFAQALYFRQRAHDARRVTVLRGVIERLGLGRAA
jgi:Flp pilus assembly protein TadD